MPTIDFSKIGEPIDATALREIFDELGLMLGGLVAMYMPTVDPEMDDFLWYICRNLDLIRSRALHRLDPKAGKLPPRKPSMRQHPAIFEFLHPRITYEEP